jgi:murein DD-endopeptidase MepM/ murein hydrolase activator NlpD
MTRTTIFHLTFGLILIFLLSGCQLIGKAEAAAATPVVALAAVDAEPANTATATAEATATSQPSATWTPLTTATAPATLTPQPTQTNTPTATPTNTVTPAPTATATAVPINRTCPDPPPIKPEYSRYFLAPTVWPQPLTGEDSTHFNFIKPVPGGGRTIINKTFPYGSDGGGRYLIHNGVDISGGMGMPLFAVADGTVVVAQADTEELYGWRCNWYGQLVVLELDEQWQGQPLYVLYGHILNINVEVGQRVQQGEQVAEVGVGGVSTVAHLHLEVRVGSIEFSTSRNPMLWIDPGETRGVVAGRLIDPQGRPWQGVVVTLIDSSEEEPEFINTWSYQGDPQNLINPDEVLAENFVFADVRPGEYILYVKLQGVEYRQTVQVTAGELTLVEQVTEPYKTPTPTPDLPPTIESTPTAVPDDNG